MRTEMTEDDNFLKFRDNERDISDHIIDNSRSMISIIMSIRKLILLSAVLMEWSLKQL
jgi:hypothetical protein